MRPDSLRFRLILASSLGIVAALAAAGGLLMALFYQHIERRFDRQLQDHLEELVAAAEANPDGTLHLTWTPADPRFGQPFSGWYWQISSQGKTLHQSKSLWHNPLTVAVLGIGHEAQFEELKDAQGADIRAIVQDVTLPDVEPAFTFVVAGPHQDISKDVWAFARQLVATLTALALALFAAVVLQIKYGLKPLRHVRAALADIRSGRATRLPQAFPEEIRPMVGDFNALLDHQERMIERARAHAGDLAHALKTPLTVIHNEARQIKGARGQVLRDYVAMVSAVIERHLSRARAAGSLALPGVTTAVKPIVDDLVYTMQRLYAAKHIDARLDPRTPLVFPGDPQDLEEMLGNLLDNACKWARTEVALDARLRDGHLLVTVEDDGPGVPEHLANDALQRGRRLDTAKPGWGLGLAIVRDLAELYGGRISFKPSRFGGLAVALDLPSLCVQDNDPEPMIATQETMPNVSSD